MFAVGYAAMSRHVADAGAFYTYVARGLGKVQGVGAAFVALLAYNAMQIGIYGLFGVAMGAFMADKVGITMDWYWWCLIAGAIIGVLGVLQIDLNARVLAVLLILEVVVVALFDFAILADPGPQGLTDVGFDPAIATGSAVGATLTFCVASFVGFESAAIYSEEARDPKRTVARATFIAVGADRRLLRALELAAGRRRRAGHDREPRRARRARLRHRRRGPDPTTVLFITGQDRLGAFWGDVGVAAVRHAACSPRCCPSTTRSRATTFALGREGVLPSVVRAREPAHRRAVDRAR